MKKVIVVGAGISGLAAAIYAKKSGFDVTIFEKHTIPGGLSTSWMRKGYLFEGGMHWLTGSSEKLALNKVWREVGALKDNNPIYYRDPFYTLLNEKGGALCLFRDINKTCDEFMQYAPEDKRAIQRLRKDVKAFLNVHLVVNDIARLKTTSPKHPKFFELLKMFPAIVKYFPLKNCSYIDYVNKFKNEDIRHLLFSVIGLRYNALSFIYTLASFSSGDCGFPIGGSIVMAKNMADEFESLGGTIEYKSEVEKVCISAEGGGKKATGVISNGEYRAADAVIVTQDTRTAMEMLFDIPLNTRLVNRMKARLVGAENMFICLGVKTLLNKYPKGIVLPLKKPFVAGGIEFNELRLNNYAEYENHSPKDCTSLTCLLLGGCYDYWKAAKEDGTYKAKKDDLAKRLIEELEKSIPEIKDKIEVIDVATPVTYERYTNAYKGSWMTIWASKKASVKYPIKTRSVKGLYFAGQRTIMPGGLPLVVYSGRKAVQYLCRDFKTVFVS